MTDPTDAPANDSGPSAAPPPNGDHGTESRTFLIADVRGYTKYTAEYGDQAAGDLVARFAELVQEVVTAREGLLLELRGDEALVVFVSARQALRAAVELQDRFAAADLPRGVGIGLDAGEAVPVGDGYRGSALNLAARLCAQAGPGEIIASEAVIHLAARLDGISYVEPRSFRLKGLAEPIRAVGVVASSRVPRGFGRRVRRARQWSRERAVLLVGGVAVVVVAIVVAALGGAFASRPSASPQASANAAASLPASVAPTGPPSGPGVAFLDAASGSVKALNASLRRPVDGQWVGDRLWVHDADPPAFHRVDPATGQIDQSISTEIDVAHWLVDGSSIWVTDNERPLLHRIDIQSRRQIDEYPLAPDPAGTLSSGGIVKAAGSLWVAVFSPSTSMVSRVDPRTGAVVTTIPDVPGQYLAATDQHIWLAAPWGAVTEIDPATNKAGAPTALTGPIVSVAAVGDDAWVANDEIGLLQQVQPGKDIAIPHFGYPGARSVSFADGKVWVAGRETASAIDAGSGTARTYPIGHSVSDVEESGGTIAVLSTTGVDDAVAKLSGTILTIASPGNPFAVIDPAVRGSTDSEEREQVDRASCAGLLAYPDQAAPAGSQIRPEVAESMPAVSADGRTYTFRIRPGYKFSPPSNEPITAETFRSTIERALDPRLGPDADGIQWLGDIVGASDYHAGKASVVSGLSSTEDTLSITLTAPSGTFLQRLTMPAFCPVPIGSARIRSGVNDPPLPRSGPYYVSDHVGGQYLILARNPNYPGPRKLGADAVVWLTGIDPADAISRLEAGTVDLVPTVEQLDPEGSIARQWGPGSSAASSGDQRYFSSDGGELGFLALNPRDPLLKDPDVRRAIALVLNRTDMARSFGMIATSGLLPSVMTGRSRSQPFKLEGSADATALDEAKRLMAGRTGSIVMSFWPDCDPCQKMATRMTSDLQAIGIGLTVETDDDPHAAASKKGSAVSLVIGFVQPRYPDTAATLNDIRSVVPPGWLGPGIDSAIAGLDRQADPDRVAAARGLVDRLERTEIPIIPFGMAWRAAYAGPGLGCEMFAPSSAGLDLVTLCRKG